MALDTLESSAKRLIPNRKPEQAMAELLLEKAQRNLIKYETTARQLPEKYQVTFEAFRKKKLAAKLNSIAEQDDFDWELAMTGIADMQSEINKLKALSRKA